jgi:hypothetical protein
MASRRALWTVLGIPAFPFLFEATLGCQVLFPLDATRPIADNKLSCDCECTPTTPDPVVSLRIVDPDDDAEQEGATMRLSETTLDLGQNPVGLRFPGLAIPQGATILRAVVRFRASADDSGETDLAVSAESSISPAAFTTADDDLSGRTFGAAVDWLDVPAWTTGDSSNAQETPDLTGLLQPLVDDPDWNSTSSLLLRIEGAGLRRASSRNDGPTRAPLLEVEYTTAVTATLPICASSDVERDGAGNITPQGQADECTRARDTLVAISGPCGYPSDCTCTPNATIGTSDVAECVAGCPDEPLDGTCSNFDPNAFESCLQAGGTLASCKHFVSATTGVGGTPVCVPSGSALAFHAFGSRSRCEVSGIAEIVVGDREPKQDPLTTGVVEFLAQPCPAGGCSVHPYFDLQMEPITFAVKWASDPTFGDLSASGRGLDAAVHSGGELTYAPSGVAGSGNGRRGAKNLAVDAKNTDALDFGIDWDGRTCDMAGNVAGSTDDDGLCADGVTPCQADSPDCDGVGGPCEFAPDPEGMEVSVVLTGEIVNQPPTAAAGPDQAVECTAAAETPFLLDGRGSSDPDANLALASWREGSRVGPLVVSGLNAERSLALGDSETYVLRVIDTFAQADEDETTVTVVDTTPPAVTCSVAVPLLSATKQTNHNLTNVGLAASAEDVCEGTLPITVRVFSDEDDEEDTGDGRHSPDAKDLAVGSLRLRNERTGHGDGRVYLVVPEATDSSGNRGYSCCTVVVPLSSKQAALTGVEAQATAARDHCVANGGAPPPGYFVSGDGPVIGPKQ